MMEWFANFGMREWLISCGILLVVVVLFDGYRRMRQERKGEIKMARRLGGGFPEAPPQENTDSDVTAELPNGGARVVERQEPSFADAANPQGELASNRIDSGEGNERNFDASVSASEQIRAKESRFREVLAEISEQEQSHVNATETPVVSQQQLLVMHAKARADSGFNGSDLLQVLLACDMRYGDRDILHRHERAGGKGSLQFSVANMLEPGTFNLEDINSFRTPGITFFMTLPGADEPESALECMLETANCVAKNLDAELLDDSHATLTDSMIGDYRQRVRAFIGSDGVPAPA